MRPSRQRLRLGVSALVLGAAFAGLAARLAALHLGDNKAMRERTARARTVRQSIRVGRGRILDRRGRILAMDRILHDVCADPAALWREGCQESVAERLARLLQLEPAMVVGRLGRAERRYVRLRRAVPDEELRAIQAAGLPHVWFEPVSVRSYPGGATACHVIGFSNVEGVGGAGIEQRFDSYLRGREGLRVSEQDGRGHELYARRTLDIAAQEGADVHLTLDLDLQEMVEAALDEALPASGAIGGWVIVQRVRTGEILAMASRPRYDLNAYGRAPEDSRLNRAIGYVYEPGSTFKAAVIARALDEGIVRADQVFDCENGRWYYRGKPLRDYHPYGSLTVADILKKSSNIGAAKIAVEMGPARLEEGLRRFGFGKPTGIELPGEEGGLLRPCSTWSAISITRIAMGHEVGVTAQQMLNALCAIANDGFLLRPTIVARLTDPRGRVLRENAPEVLSRPLSAAGARRMCALLERVTEPGGTGSRAAVPGYRVAGKTGTAQKPIPGGYSDDRNIASFLGVLPADRPEIGIIVVLDEPKPARTGGLVAAPVFAAIAQQAVRHLGIAPDGPPRVIDPTIESPGSPPLGEPL